MMRFRVSFLLFVCLVIFANGSNRPNILLMIPDQWRFDWADNYYSNLSVNTPTFSMVVENGTRFTNTIVASPVCTCSRSCLASGQEYDESGVPENMMDFPENKTTFYKLLQLNGYYTMVTGKDDLTKKTGPGVNGSYRANELGFDAQCRCIDKSGLAAKYPAVTDPFAAYLANISLYTITDECSNECCNTSYPEYECPEWIDVPYTAYQDNWVTTNSLRLLDDKPVNTPWFMQANFVGPHPPFFILEAMNETVNNRSFPAAMHSSFDPDSMQIVRRDYIAEIENLDKQFQIILNKIIDLNEFNNTIICIASDHGEMLGDYSLWQKSKPWRAATDVPLTCMGPNIIKKQIIKQYVTLLDLAGTFMDYADVDSEFISDLNMTTQSLRPFLNGTWNDNNNQYRKYVSSGLSSFRLVVQPINETTTWKFICCQKGCPGRQFANSSHQGYTKLLFNLINDPYENNNVAQQYEDVVQDMIQYLPSNAAFQCGV